MIKAVIFDIDNTMYNFDKAHKAAMAALAVYTGKNFGMGPEETDELVKKCMDIVTERTGDNCAALHNRLLRFQCFLEEIGSADYQKALEMYHIYWDTLLDAMEPEPGLVPLLRRLKQRGIRTGIGTDMTAYIQYKKLEKIGVLQYLDFLVTSEEAGAEKPSPRFFELCLKKAGCEPSECIFIGDNLKKDVAGSTAFGMVGTWYMPNETGAERNECASCSVSCRETRYMPNEAGTGTEQYPVVTSFEEFLPAGE